MVMGNAYAEVLESRGGAGGKGCIYGVRERSTQWTWTLVTLVRAAAQAEPMQRRMRCSSSSGRLMMEL
jgi:hypothetical protein